MHVPRCRARALGAVLAVCLSPPVAAAEAGPALRLEVRDLAASAGYFQLRWEGGGDTIALQQATDEAFDEPRQWLIAGRSSKALTGLPDGVYHYRAGALDDSGEVASWGEPVTVEIEHHPLSRAFGFFAAGCALFVTLVAVILRNRRIEEAG